MLTWTDCAASCRALPRASTSCGTVAGAVGDAYFESCSICTAISMPGDVTPFSSKKSCWGRVSAIPGPRNGQEVVILANALTTINAKLLKHQRPLNAVEAKGAVLVVPIIRPPSPIREAVPLHLAPPLPPHQNHPIELPPPLLSPASKLHQLGATTAGCSHEKGEENEA